MIAEEDRKIFRKAILTARSKAEKNLERFGSRFPGPNTLNGKYPPEPEGSNTGWTTSFWTGILWLLRDYFGGPDMYSSVLDDHLASFAERAAGRKDCEHHDMGFLFSLSCVPAFKLNDDREASATALLAADILLERYLKKAGVIQAWGKLDDSEERGKMIIDSLMNLPLLYWAGETTGDPKYRTCAYRHALNAVNNLVRDDSTTYHTFYFDPETGRPLRGSTKQGYSEQSCWARGQAWAIYGFALSYSYTKDPDFLKAAVRTAEYFLSKLPEDKVVFWDLIFGDGSEEKKDSSAAAIAVCGLHEIAGHVTDPAEKLRFSAAAEAILTSLCENYSTAADDDNEGMILHGVYYMAGNIGVDESNLWGDYFYLEGLVRMLKDWEMYW